MSRATGAGLGGPGEGARKGGLAGTTSPQVILTGLFGFRLLYGLSMPFWYEDERQVYLVGLQSFARGEWPYFGADVVWTGGQIPGALLGWLIRLPLAIWPAPEAPFILLNLLSFSALGFLAWYLSHRLPSVPRWLIWSTLLTLPWTLNFSTHIVNPSYAIVGAILFFVGFFEGMPALTNRILPFTTAWALMGFGLLWVMQLHLSWVLLVPYVPAALAWIALKGAAPFPSTRVGALAAAGAAFVLGAAIPASLLVPTVLRFGWAADATRGAVAAHMESPIELVTTTARVLSFASFEVNRFLGLSTSERWLLMLRQIWSTPAAAIVVIAGLLQPIWMALSALRPAPAEARDWTRVRVLLAATILLIFVSYFYSIRGPQAHSFYVVFPVAALFAFTCWSERARAHGGSMRRLERIAAVVIVANLVMHLGLAIDRWRRLSLYVDRPLVAAAIADSNDRYLGDRRDAHPYVGADAIRDVRIVRSSWAPRAGGVSSFDLAVTNDSRDSAWLDLRLATSYANHAGVTIDTREVVVKQILEPGESRTWTDVTDGFIPAGAVSATIQVTAAERAVPARRPR